MSVANALTNLAAGAGGAGIVTAGMQALFSYRSRRADAAKTETDTWREAAKDVLAEVRRECADCRKQLLASDGKHEREIATVRGELGDVRDALIKRVDVVDELLPYVQGLPPEKMRELRAENQAVKVAVVRSSM